MKYRVTGVRRDRADGREHIVLAELTNDEGTITLRGTLEHVLLTCEQRGYNVGNLEQAKTALERSKKIGE